jgi:transposase
LVVGGRRARRYYSFAHKASQFFRSRSPLLAKPLKTKELSMTFQLRLFATNGILDAVSQENKGLAGGNQQAPYLETDAIARNQSLQLSLWAIAKEKARHAMKVKQLRGLEIATTHAITQQGGVWIVPSQNSNKKYTVNLHIQTCTCPDFEAHRLKCKHIYAVEYTLQHERGEALPPPEPEKKVRPTYKQEWHAYNLAQVNEKAKLQELLYALCSQIEEPMQHMGRPRISIADRIFAATFKVYSMRSFRRCMSDMREAKQRGYLQVMPQYNSIFRYLESKELTPYLMRLIVESSLPLKSVEEVFAADSSGFSTGRYQKWVDAKWGEAQTINKRDWVKVHIMCGCKTNIVTAVKVTDAHAGDSPQFRSLVETTAENFVMNSVCADKAYSSNNNLALVARMAAMPYIPFKSNSTAKNRRSTSVWRRMFHYYQYNQEEFMRHYHQRSNVETTFSMIKAKFGERLKSKKETAQINEVLCKILCHNLCCVIQSIYELGIEPTFWNE